jgi:hypothetical protein
MKSPRLLFCSFLLVLIAAMALACSTSRLAQSVTVSPTTADAQDFADGQVQFTATGYYNQEPSPVTPLTATWGVCSQNGNQNGVSVNASGLAQCGRGATGTYKVKVFASVQNPSRGVCTVDLPCGGEGCGQVVGTAQLTCP